MLNEILEGNSSIELKVKSEQEHHVEQGMCVECEDMPASLRCEQCSDDYCQHRKGTRKSHQIKPFATAQVVPSFATEPSREPAQAVAASDLISAFDPPVSSGFLDRSVFIPMRLSYSERKYLRLLEAALTVCEYTDKIDVLSSTHRSTRIVSQIKEICSILSGLVLAADYSIGQKLFKDRDFAENSEFFQDIFELGRRHKIMNPEKMRSTYGKLVYMLQDSQIPEVKELLGFDCIKPLRTVHSVLEKYQMLSMLDDPLMEQATAEIVDLGKSRREVQADIKKKERTIEYFAKKFTSADFDSDTIRQCLYSIGDNNAFLRSNRDPCEKMIGYLQKYFDPKEIEKGFSLSIQSGHEGARLSHGHEKQYQYVIQSLSLWREVLHDMFKLWIYAEQDLLESNNWYKLRDTGQGLNRVQAAPRVSRMMHTILHRAQKKIGSWVGSSVIHLGDHNVPNALMFIDKYTQIYRILLPMVTTIQKIDSLQSASLGRYIEDAFDSHEEAKKFILSDFFKHGFDGSGADNFFDAGSCIDGRLTSAWNWCSKVEKKAYFPLFLLTGFMGFDGGEFA